MNNRTKPSYLRIGALTFSLLTFALAGCSLIKESPKEIAENAKLASNPIFMEFQKVIAENAEGRMVIKGTGKYFDNSTYSVKNISGNTIVLEYNKKTIIAKTSEVIEDENISYEIHLDKLKLDNIKKSKKLYGYFCIFINDKNAVEPLTEDSFFKEEAAIPFTSRIYANKAEKLLKQVIEEVDRDEHIKQ